MYYVYFGLVVSKEVGAGQQGSTFEIFLDVEGGITYLSPYASNGDVSPSVVCYPQYENSEEYLIIINWHYSWR